MDTPKIPLTDKTLERELCGHFLAWGNDELFKNCRKFLNPEDFSDRACNLAWRLFAMTFDAGENINMVSVNNVAFANGIDATDVLLIDAKEPLASPMRMALHLHEIAVRRRIIARLREMTAQLTDPEFSSEDALNAMMDIVGQEKPAETNIVPWKTYGKEVLLHAEKLMNGEDVPTIRCGLRPFDAEGGLRAGDLDIIAGRTSNGKSSLAMTMAMGCAMRGTPVGVFTLEMTAKDIAFRMAGMLSGIPASRIMVRPLNEDEFSKLYTSMQPRTIAEMPIYFAKPKRPDIESVTSLIRQLVKEHGVRLVVIDYVQLLYSKGKELRVVVGQAANVLKALAVELDITILLLSQLARQQKGATAVPKMYELKESGELENAADNVWLIYRPELYRESFPDMSREWSQYDTRDNALIIQSKARSGPVGEFLLGYSGATNYFFDRDSYPTADFSQSEDEPF